MDMKNVFESRINRRRLLGQMGAVGAGAVLAQYGSLAFAQDSGPDLDAKILNFALNLEYLEAEFYLRAAFGRGLADEDIGDNPGEVIGGSKVEFESDAVREYAEEIALDEENHVKFLRSALGDQAVSRPKINFTDAFTTAARAAGVIPNDQTLNHFKSEGLFLNGAFLFEDVGVTAYYGAAPFISNPDFIEAAAGILAVEAYHAAEARTLLYSRLGTEIDKVPVQRLVQIVSNARDFLDGDGDMDQGIVQDNPFGTMANIVPTNENGLVFARTPFQVLNIVYLDLTRTATPGGFFPDGLNGDFSGVPSL
ncbi:ferritin-like domain-containing protein [soil metagenome]